MWKGAARYGAMEMMAGKPLLVGPVRLRFLWIFQRPGRLLKGDALYTHHLYDGSKDIDNLEKALMDAMNKVVYVDDKQVTSVDKQAVYGGPEDKPGCWIWVARDRLRSWAARLLAPLPARASASASATRRRGSPCGSRGRRRK